jgi:hypothetical protein
MKDLISYIAKALVDQPGKVSVNEIEGEHTNVLELSALGRKFGDVFYATNFCSFSSLDSN